MRRDLLYYWVGYFSGELPDMDYESPKTTNIYKTDLEAPYFGGNFSLSIQWQ
jgi:hypothetical protein